MEIFDGICHEWGGISRAIKVFLKEKELFKNHQESVEGSTGWYMMVLGQ